MVLRLVDRCREGTSRVDVVAGNGDSKQAKVLREALAADLVPVILNPESRRKYILSVFQQNDILVEDFMPHDSPDENPSTRNSFTYFVRARKLTSSSCSQPSASQLQLSPSDGAQDLVFQLHNPLCQIPRSKNFIPAKVSALLAARQALSTREPSMGHIVPRVCAHQESSFPTRGLEDCGWVITERLPGVSLAKQTGTMSTVERRAVLTQVGDIMTALHGADGRLGRWTADEPAWGGIVSDSDHSCCSKSESGVETRMSNLGDYLAARMRAKLVLADKSRHLLGWRPRGLRTAIEMFLDSGIQDVLLQANVDANCCSLVHGELTPGSILYDHASHRMTGLVSFSSAVLLHPAYEAPVSFGPQDGDSEFAAEWNAELKRRLSAQFPSTEIGALGRLREIEEALCPVKFASEAYLPPQGKGSLENTRARAEARLMTLLDPWMSKESGIEHEAEG